MSERTVQTVDQQDSRSEVQTPKVEFNGGAFTISAFSPSAEGFQFHTRNILRRADASSGGRVDIDPERTEQLALMDARIALAREREVPEEEIGTLVEERRTIRRALGPNASRIRDAMAGEMQFSNVKAVRDARDAWLGSKGSEEEAAELENTFHDERKKYLKKGKKIGLRNIQVEGNDVRADVKEVLFAVYNASANPNDSEAMLDLSAATGTAMILRSSDNRLVIQHRAVSKQRLSAPGLSKGNASYNDQPGASVAGMLDASLTSPDRKRGTPDRVDTDSITGNILKEASEELGLAPEDMKALRIVGVAQDRVKIHDELLLLADTKLDAAAIRQKSRDSVRNLKLGAADFEEKFVDIPATKEAVETLLTDVKCPLPPTHYAAMVAAGYSIVLQESGGDVEAAEKWKRDLEPKMKDNIEAMNQIVTDYYNKHPEALTQVPERFWDKKRIPGRNPNGYTPAYAPDEQGLPSFEDEMTRTHLIPETRRHVDEVLMFDVDGPLSDPSEKQIKLPELVTKLSERLAAGEPVFLNTGRSTAWVMERVVKKIEETAGDPSVLENLVVIGEKGGTWVTFDANGQPQDGQILLKPQEKEKLGILNQRIKDLIAGDEEFKGSMDIDPTKITMVSAEMRDGFDKEPFKTFGPIQARFTTAVQAIVAEMELDNFIVDPTTIATDIENKYVGKALGSDRSLQWLRDRGIKPGRFVAFGDSISDLGMADELQRRGEKVAFIYVGNPDRLAEAKAAGRIKDESIIENIGGYSGGTLEYLSR